VAESLGDRGLQTLAWSAFMLVKTQSFCNEDRDAPMAVSADAIGNEKSIRFQQDVADDVPYE
jgi:hypothetical protein